MNKVMAELRTVAFHTLGCKVNQYETEAMAEMFRKQGYEVVDEREFADVYVINTCTVTAVADKKSRQYVRRMKKVNPDSIVVVTGCYSQISPEEVRQIKGVDIITGTNEKQNIPAYVKSFISKNAMKAEASAYPGEVRTEKPAHAVEMCAEEPEYPGEVRTEKPAHAIEMRTEEPEYPGEVRTEKSVHAAEIYTGKPICADKLGAAEIKMYINDRDELLEFIEMGPAVSTENRTRAYIKVQEGCDRFCSYCVIPYARGPVRSRPLENIVEEAKLLLQAGYRELVLTGINTAQYDMEGRNLYEPDTDKTNQQEADPCVIDYREVNSGVANQQEANTGASGSQRPDTDKTNQQAPGPGETGQPESGMAAGSGGGLSKLPEEIFGIEKVIAALSDIPGEFRIRLSSLEPAVVNSEYVKRLFKYDKLCHHLHMSAQSGSSSILRAMNRPYDIDGYYDLVNTLFEFDECYGISTDIIVGFPGEKDSDFSDSCNLVRECCFCRTHIFKYSKRPMTKAAEMSGQVSPQIKNRRSDELETVAKTAAAGFFEINMAAAAEGRTERVLIEEKQQMKDGREYFTGYTGNYIKTYIPVSDSLRSGTHRKLQFNEFAEVRLKDILYDGMLAEPV